MFGMDLEAAQDRVYGQIEAIRKVLASAGDHVEMKYLERLTEDRNRLIFGLHYQLSAPVLEIAERTGIPWPQVYDLVDARFAKRQEKSAQKPEPAQEQESLTEGYASELEDDDELQVGDRVRYCPGHLGGDEYGVITELLPERDCARVRYDGEQTAKLTPLDRLIKAA